MILTESLEELSRSKLPVKENGAVVDVENSAHADQQDLQASCNTAYMDVNHQCCFVRPDFV